MTRHIKDILFSLMILLLTACADSDTVDVVTPAAVATAPVTFTMTVPQEVTGRAADGVTYSDGTKATQVFYAIYSWANGKAALVETNVAYTAAAGTTSCYKDKQLAMNNLQVSVDFTLAIGMTYKVVFWAQNADAPYSFDPVSGAINIDYNSDSFKCNDDNLDAFCACDEVTVSSAGVSRTVALKRPFTQLNIGDTANNTNVEKTSLIVTSAATTYNLITGERSNFKQCEFSYNAMPSSEGIDFPVDGAQYVAMVYFIPTSDSQDVDVYLEFYEDGYDKIKFLEGITVNPNGRTNVYGDVFTLEDHDDYYIRYSDNVLSLISPEKLEYVGNGEYIYKYGDKIGTFSASCGIFMEKTASVNWNGKFWSATKWSNRPTNQDFTEADRNSYGYLNAHLNCKYSYPLTYSSLEFSWGRFTNKIFITGNKAVENLIIRFNPTKQTLYFTGNYVE